MPKTRKSKGKKYSQKFKKQYSDNTVEKETDLNNGVDDTAENRQDILFLLKPVSIQLSRCEVPNSTNKNNNLINDDISSKLEDEISKKNCSRTVKNKDDSIKTKKTSNNKSITKNNYVEKDIEKSGKEEENITKKNKKNVTVIKRTIRSKNEESSSDESSDTEYEVQRIMEVKFLENGKREFLIRWKGFRAEDDTWEKEEHLNCHELLEQFLENIEKKKLRPHRQVTKRLVLGIDRLKSRSSTRNRKIINYQED
ncbi:uncharacterized protein LOC126903206 isoform X2 [Daktulosphaira vitifoliae]|uniref:uncharacterized protein LOC126903206 isoform X2 n=1 Tax=Daktulosphaira vitifoliae TaxID=58002 RepID=UPI0021A9B8DB|nr:uncharacterized protein LOC126903206 isoform X2 [Daktulosphaira vitifoliae]